MVVQLFAGIFVGAVLASIGWGIFVKTAKNKSEQVRRVREELMHDLGELWVDIDTLISSFRAGMMDERTFKNSFTAKIDAINHMLKPNLHLFEVYYVKYMETLIKEYNRIVHLREIPTDMSPSSDFSSEMETSYAPPPEQTDLFKTTPDEEKPEAEASAESSALPEGSFVDDKTHLVEPEGTVPDGIVDTVVMEQVEESSTAIVDELAPAVSDEVDEMFEEAFSSIEGETKSKYEPVLPPAGEVVVATDTTQSDIHSVEIDQEVSDETIMGFDHPMLAGEKPSAGAQQTSLFSKLASEASHIGDEDFSMETLMDVDLNTIASHVAKESVSSDADDDIEKTRHFELPPEDKPDAAGKTELEVVIASDASHADSSEEKEPVDDGFEDIPEETTYTRAEELEKRTAETGKQALESPVDEDFEVIIPDSSTSQSESSLFAGEESPESDSDDSITGDDVADKIAALEGIPVKTKESPAEVKVEEKIPAPAKKEEVAVEKPKEVKPLSLKESEEAITGDDVAEQIDSFFGLFKEE